jgi:hypothetical protein
MIRLAMRTRFWAVVGLAVAGAQAGHLLAYRLRFGSMAEQIESTGVHAYFPAVVKTALGVAALALIGALLVVAAARVAARGRGARRVSGPTFIGALAALFTLQLAWFVGQELVESLVAGAPRASVELLLLWGMVGQLPIAVAGAAVVVWLGERVEAAIAILGTIELADMSNAITAPLLLQPVVAGDALVRARPERSRIVRRGPPLSS